MILRFMLSAVLGAIVVAGLLLAGVVIHRHGSTDAEPVYASPVHFLTGAERIEMGKLLGEDWDPNRRRLPEPQKAPPMMPPRQISGFVQLQFNVDASGTASDIDVVGATPAGLYEEQARAMIESRRYAPTYDAMGVVLPGRRTEIVDFSVTAPAQASDRR